MFQGQLLGIWMQGNYYPTKVREMTLAPGTKVWPVRVNKRRAWMGKPVRLNRTTVLKNVLRPPLGINDNLMIKDRLDEFCYSPLDQFVREKGKPRTVLVAGFVFKRKDLIK